MSDKVQERVAEAPHYFPCRRCGEPDHCACYHAACCYCGSKEHRAPESEHSG